MAARKNVNKALPVLLIVTLALAGSAPDATAHHNANHAGGNGGKGGGAGGEPGGSANLTGSFSSVEATGSCDQPCNLPPLPDHRSSSWTARGDAATGEFEARAEAWDNGGEGTRTESHVQLTAYLEVPQDHSRIEVSVAFIDLLSHAHGGPTSYDSCSGGWSTSYCDDWANAWAGFVVKDGSGQFIPATSEAPAGQTFPAQTYTVIVAGSALADDQPHQQEQCLVYSSQVWGCFFSIWVTYPGGPQAHVSGRAEVKATYSW